MLNLPLADSNGAVLLHKKIFKKLNAEQQSILRRLSKEYFDKLTQLSREDNEKSLELIRSSGIKMTSITDPQELKKFDEAGKQARISLIGKLYDNELLNKVENTLYEFRSENSAMNAPDSPRINK